RRLMRRREIVLIINHPAGGGFPVKTRAVPRSDAGLSKARAAGGGKEHLRGRHRTGGEKDKQDDWTCAYYGYRLGRPESQKFFNGHQVRDYTEIASNKKVICLTIADENYKCFSSFTP